MARSIKLILSEYIVNEYARQELSVMDAEKYIRWGRYDSHDVAQLQLLRCRFDAFREFANAVMGLCKISEDDVIDYCNERLSEKNP